MGLVEMRKWISIVSSAAESYVNISSRNMPLQFFACCCPKERFDIHEFYLISEEIPEECSEHERALLKSCQSLSGKNLGTLATWLNLCLIMNIISKRLANEFSQVSLRGLTKRNFFNGK